MALKLQQERLTANRVSGELIGQDPRYYDQVLALFGQGWIEHRFSFSPQGQLVVKWKPACTPKK
jgi:endoglucanase